MVSIIVRVQKNEHPLLHTFYDNMFDEIKPVFQSDTFFVYEFDEEYIEDGEIVFYYSPTIGSTQTHRINVSRNQRFCFVDLAEPLSLVSFESFYSFFSDIITDSIVSFSFNEDNPFDSIKCFLLSFPSHYLIWSLTFLSLQPWYSIFIFNEEFSKLIIELSIPYIEEHFCRTSHRNDNITNFFDYNATIHNPFAPSSTHYYPKNSFRSLESYSDVFLSLIRIQLGDIYAFLFSAIIDFNQEFPYTSFIPPLVSNNRKYVYESDMLMKRLANKYLNYNDINRKNCLERLFLTCISIISGDSTESIFDTIKLISHSVDSQLFDIILKLRMFESTYVSYEALKTVFDIFPNIPNAMREFHSPNCSVPVEWLSTFFEVFKIDDPDLRTAITNSSIRVSHPLHIQKNFCETSEMGALVLGETNTNAVLLPGSIVQPDAILGENSMLMSGAVSVSKSILGNNQYAPLNSLVLPEESNVSLTALIQHPSQIKKGVTIGDNAIVCSGSLIEMGVVIKDRAIIARGSTIGPGATILEGETVPPGFFVPCGFKFSNRTVEFARRIPECIFLRGKRFVKPHLGSVDASFLISIPSVSPSDILVSYFELMKDYPSECGRQISANSMKLNCCGKERLVSDHLSDVFEKKTLLFSIAFWESHEEKSPDWIKIVQTATEKVVHNFHLFIDEFEDDSTARLILEIAQRFDMFHSNGIDLNELESMKKVIFETCDELFVRLSLLSNTRESKLYRYLSEIVSLTHNL